MPKSMKSQTEDIEMVENDDPIRKSSTIFNQQNNYHLAQNINMDSLSNLSEKSPDLAMKVMELYERQQAHNISIDKEIIKLERTEQRVRIKEVPFQRKFAFQSLYFAMSLSILSLISATVFAYLGHPYLAGTAITIPIGVGVANFLGSKAHLKRDKEELEDI